MSLEDLRAQRAELLEQFEENVRAGEAIKAQLADLTPALLIAEEDERDDLAIAALREREGVDGVVAARTIANGQRDPRRKARFDAVADELAAALG